MLTIDIAAIVFISLLVFFIGFHWGTARRKRVAEDQYFALVRKTEDEQERKEAEHIQAEEARWHEWMQRYECDKEEREAKAEARRQKEEDDRLRRAREAEEGFWRLFPEGRPTTKA